MHRPKKRTKRWLWVMISALVVAAVAYGVVRTMGSKPKKQEPDRSPALQQLDRSIDHVAAILTGALQVRDRMRAGPAGATQARAELDSLRQDLERVAAVAQQAETEPSLVQATERVSRFAANAARQVGALASDAPADSLERTEARLRAMLTAAGRLRASVAPRPGNPS
ncbi:MAG TPA: hypothetical protein VFX78_08640 [Candidatus Eisenbacteria bacterium]|nr:hypothetical protein [Candidatus Eisenbacteria bacterium]